MYGHADKSRACRARGLATVIIAMMTATHVGCAFKMNVLTETPWNQQQCVLPPDPTLPELVSHLNSNRSLLNEWRSTDLHIRIHGLPLGLQGMIAVKRQRNLRLMISSNLTGHEADLGSNSERFWFWMRQGEPKHVFTARHDQAAVAQRRLSIPFEPDWLMEALGVIPLNESEYTLHPHPDDSKLVSLVAPAAAYNTSLQRVLIVDTCTGHIVAHELRDAAQRVIAAARLSDYKLDPESGITLPHHIELISPFRGMEMDMRVGHVIVNPQTAPGLDKAFQMQRYEGYPVIDLGAPNSQFQRAEHMTQQPPLGHPAAYPAGYATSVGSSHVDGRKPRPFVPGQSAQYRAPPSAKRRIFRLSRTSTSSSKSRFFPRFWRFGRRRR